MHGIGNDFVLYDCIRDGDLEVDLGQLARQVCDRKFGVGADGLILLRKPGELQMQMLNPDGSESEMCGNGLRAFARLAFDRSYSDAPAFQVLTGAGSLKVSVANSEVTVDMGPAKLKPEEIGMLSTGDSFINQSISGSLKGTAVSMGNPHLVLFVGNLDAVDLEKDGPLLEMHPFFPQRTNVHFAQVKDADHIIMKTWERGAGATLACGTGACATAVASFLNGLTSRKVAMTLPGGQLSVEYLESGNVLMSGTAEYVFEGHLRSFL